MRGVDRAAHLAVDLRRGAGALAADSFYRAASVLGRLHPDARPERHGVERLRDVAYAPTAATEHRLDVYRPTARPGPLPVVLYVHGGGFRILSKDSHWVMGLAFASRGYLVFNINYRLAPRHPFPAGLDDCATAFAWVVRHASDYGGDVGRLVLAGESAGANLISALTVMSCYRRDEPYARRVFDTGVLPRAWMPFCGMLQVSDGGRFLRQRPGLGTFIHDRLLEVSTAYLGDDPARHGAALALADPLVLLESGRRPDRPLPPCFVSVGTSDPLLDDTRRLERALEALAVDCVAAYYPGQRHAFHAVVLRADARRCWRDAFRFLRRRLGEQARTGGRVGSSVHRGT
jgi:acetyl esterase